VPRDPAPLPLNADNGWSASFASKVANSLLSAVQDGYFHLSTPSQVLGTLDRFFADVPAVTLLRIDYGRLSGFKTVKWEQAGSGGKFRLEREVDQLGRTVADPAATLTLPRLPVRSLPAPVRALTRRRER
jgi:uncharacterized protein (DUF952 family)